MLPTQVGEGGPHWLVFNCACPNKGFESVWCRVLSNARTSSLFFDTLKETQNVLFVQLGAFLVQPAEIPA